MTRRTLQAGLIAAAGLVLSGCLELEETITVFPDGSGKIEVLVGFHADWDGRGFAVMEMSRRLKREFEGAVAFRSAGTGRDQDHLSTQGLVVYFDDINKLKFYRRHGKARELVRSFRMARTGADTMITIHDPLLAELKRKGASGRDDAAPVDEDTYDTLLIASRGLNYTSKICLPGRAKKGDGFHTLLGRDASILVTDELLYADDKGDLAMRELRDSLAGERSVSWGASELTEEEKQAWAKELEEAKASPNLPPRDKK